jgi:tetratricopeptide (TPR) repeat protein
MTLRRRYESQAALASLLAAWAIPLTLVVATPPDAHAQDAAPAAAAGAAGEQVWTPTELTEMAAFEEHYRRYVAASEEHHARMRAILYREYEGRKTQLDKQYSDKVGAGNDAHRKRHLDAMRLLEEFLAKYPNHPDFSPDAMFRLADLYLDEANYQYEKEQELITAGLKAPPPPPEFVDGEIPYEGPDYSKAIATWRDIIARFPGYRQADGTLYLLGYYLGQIGQERHSNQVYLGLVCANQYRPLDDPPPPPSKDEVRAKLDNKAAFSGYENCTAASPHAELVEEAWVRGVGDAHFNTPGELSHAIAAYKKVATTKASKYYDEALYKLAWSYYRSDHFVEGIAAFDESIAYSDKIVTEGGDALELRQEAVTYIAISFTDPWSSDEQPDAARAYDRAMAFYKDRFDQPHVRDVYDNLGDTFRILEGYEQAIDSWRLAIDKWPLHPSNPQVHQKIVSALEAMGDKDLADEEAAKLAQRYAKGSEWYKANETNRVAMEDQARIGQRMFRASAENTHRSAQLARKDWEADPSATNKERYLALYTQAAQLYRSYLDEFPDTQEIYEFTYRVADCLFFSEQYAEAVGQYRWVRDHRDLGDKYYLKAAVSIVQAYQKEVDKQIDAGALVEPPVPTVDALKGMAAVEPIAIPQVYVDLQAAYDEYQRLVEDPQTAPTMALAAALVSYRHLHIDDSIGRFEVVLERFCGSEAATRAKDGLLVIYEHRGDDVKFKTTNDRFISSQCGDEGAIAIARAQNRSKEFQEAEKMFTDKRYDEAALAFYQYYFTAKDEDPNRPVALYNSAIAYDRSGRPKTAIHLFGEFTSNTSPAFRTSAYYLEALFLTAVAHQSAFDYQSAVDVYLDVVRIAKQPGTPEPPGGRSLHQIQLDALFNAGLLRELDRVYKDPKNQPGTGAVSLYRRYYELETDRRKRDRTVWAIARVHESERDMRAMIDAYGEWRREFGRDAGNEQDYVFTFYNTAKMWEKRGAKEADPARRDTISAWADVGSPKGTPIAEMAAEFEFYYAEQDYQKSFEPFKVKWPKKESDEAIKKTLDDFDAFAETTLNKFAAVGKYESPLYGFAGLVRVGDVRYFHGQKLIDAPPPVSIQKLDEKYPDRGILNSYLSNIEQRVQPLLDEGIRQWKKVTTAAKDQGVNNKWTRLAQERLHDFVSPDEFPVLRDDLIGGTETP